MTDDTAETPGADAEGAGGTLRTLRRRTSALTDAPAEAVMRIEAAEGERIEMHQGSIGAATGRSVAVHQGAIGRAHADEVLVRQGAIGGARAQSVHVDRGAVGGVLASEVDVRQGYIQGVLARDVSVEMGGVRTVIANRVTFGRQSGAFIVIARTVDGNGRIVLDWRGALALGAAFAVVFSVLRVLTARR